MRSARTSRYSRSTGWPDGHAEAAVQLHGRVDDPLCRLGRVELGHRRLARDPLGAGVLRPRGAIDEERRGVDVERHVRELSLHELELGERCAEELAVGGASERLVERPAGKAERRGADGGAEHVERRHRHLEAARRARRRARRPGRGSSSNSSVASGWGAMICGRSAIERPGVSASTRNADRPRAPGASPVRATTT